MAGPSLATLNDELTQLTDEREALRQRHAGEVMPGDARDRDAWIVNRVSEIRVLVEAEKQRQRDQAMADTADWMSRPAGQITHPLNADDAGRKSMLNAGWSFQNGMVYRQTSLGEVAYVPEGVLFGSIPTSDAVSALHFKQTRAIFQPEYRDAWTRYIAVHGDRAQLTGVEQAALSEGVAEGGGYLVPPDIAAEILARRARSSVMRSLCSVRQTSRNVYEIPAVAPNSSSGSIYSSGFVGGLVGETPTSNTDAGPTFQNFSISVKKYEVFTRASNDLIADASSDVMAFLATDGGRNLGLVEDNYFLTGLGTGLEPLGLLNSGATTVDVEGSTSNTLDNTVSAAGSAPKIINLFYELPQQYADNATWLCSRATQGLIHALVDGDGRPWWQPSMNSGGAGTAPPVLVGAPLRTSAFMPEDGTNANKVLVIGDFSQAIIADRQGLSVRVDDMNLIGSDQTQIFIRSRSGFGVWNTDAFRFGIV